MLRKKWGKRLHMIKNYPVITLCGSTRFKKKFMEAKTKLYSKEEVKEYFLLESKINAMLEEDMNSLKDSISNKFKKQHSLKL